MEMQRGLYVSLKVKSTMLMALMFNYMQRPFFHCDAMLLASGASNCVGQAKLFAFAGSSFVAVHSKQRSV